MYRLWRALAHSGQQVQGGGHRLRVLHPGRLNLNRGPDFVAADIEFDGVRIRGDVELHLRPSDWFAHAHHLDGAYRNVVLHVVASGGKKRPAPVPLPQSNQSAPTFVLNPAQLPGAATVLETCQLPGRLPLKALRQLALQRLNSKVRYYQQQRQQRSYAQLIYEHFFRALGYPANQDAFQHLAMRLPWQWVQTYASQFWSQQPLLLALYAGQAGFLPGQSSDPFVQHLIQWYSEFKQRLPVAALSAAHWQFAGVRACNHPHFRLAGWVALLQQHGVNLFENLYQLFSRRQPPAALWRQMVHFFHLPATGYWESHYRFGPSHPLRRKFYFGNGRIVEFLINVFIPLFMVRALESQSYGFFDYLNDFYLSLPLQQVYASFSRRFPALGLYLQSVPRQYVLQALLHVQQEYCAFNFCKRCPLRHVIDKNGGIN